MDKHLNQLATNPLINSPAVDFGESSFKEGIEGERVFVLRVGDQMVYKVVSPSTHLNLKMGISIKKINKDSVVVRFTDMFVDESFDETLYEGDFAETKFDGVIYRFLSMEKIDFKNEEVTIVNV